MSWMTSAPVLALRRVGRLLGLNSRIARLLHGDGYETGYDSAFQQSLRSGDCVWDVGANVGYYTRLFSGRVGETGRVLAFEPSPINHRRLREGCTGLANVKTFNFGIGADDGEFSFQQGDDELGATSRVVSGVATDPERKDRVTVRVRAGDALVAEGSAEVPNAIKIDVEGFEPEVIHGLSATLADRNLRLVGIEMHFSILQERGSPTAPRTIEATLQSHGFSTRWPDSSHLLAVRD